MSRGALGSTTITQVALVVSDIEAKARAWAEVLGVPVPPVRVTAGADESNIRYEGEPTDARAKLAFFQLGQTALELIEPIGGPSTWRDHLERHGEGVHHVAFQIEGMDERLADLEALGIRPVQRGDFTGGRYGYADASAQLGVVLELLERDRPSSG